jgi:PBP1b-binding outer membrane lipoprotein LpoB
MLRYYICIVISIFFFSSCFFQQKVVKNEPKENKETIGEKGRNIG